MAKATTHYVCQSCGASQPKWSGQCESCHAWNSLVEETIHSQPPKSLKTHHGHTLEFVPLKGPALTTERCLTQIEEFDRVCGGGLVPGSVLLVGGDPGIGKSTLLLQVASTLSPHLKCAYISGEEAIDQVRLRARRLSLEEAPLLLASATNLRDILKTLEGPSAPEIVIIDSIQTMYMDTLDSAPGTVAQVRACSQELIRVAKNRNIILIIVGHVTKEGMLAGPRVLEHMVDTVLYFEGDRSHHFRILRAVKNRFGPTDEIGVFEMTGKGLSEVKNPSAFFLAERQEQASGSTVFAGIEGSRPILVEIQALVAPSALPTPRRAVIGWDSARLAMVLAVLDTRGGVSLRDKDIYLNIAGGLKITEPAADLAVAAALLSAFTDKPVPQDAVVFGEIGLSGEIRAVSQKELRLKEAAKLGFKKAIAPKSLKKKDNPDMLALYEMANLQEMLKLFPLKKPSKRTKESF